MNTLAGSEHSVADQLPKVLILTPVKDAGTADAVAQYFERLRALSYPSELLSIGILEGDSRDDTYRLFAEACETNSGHFRRVQLWKKDFGFHIPDGMPRWEPKIQYQRRSILAKSRNRLLFHALDDEDWVLWLDVDVIEFCADVIEKLLSYKRDIVHPHCVKEYGGRSFDANAWRDQGSVLMHDMRESGEIVPLDSVGGTMLLVRADCHRDGLIFPPFLYGGRNPKARMRADIFMPRYAGEIETEGLGIMAYDMSLECWGLPHLEILHAKA